MGAPIGAFVGVILIVVSIVVGLFAGVGWGAGVLSALAYLFFAIVIITIMITKIPKDSLLMISLRPTDREVAQMFHLFIITPGASTLYAGLMNIFRLSLIIWGIVCMFYGEYLIGGVAIAYFVLTTWHIVRLDPYAYLGPRAEKGHQFSIEQIQALDRIQERRQQLS